MDDEWLRADAVAPGSVSGMHLADRVCWWCDGPIAWTKHTQPMVSWQGGLRFWHYNCYSVANVYPMHELFEARTRWREACEAQRLFSHQSQPQEAISAKSSDISKCLICGQSDGSLRPPSWTCEQCQPPTAPDASSSNPGASASQGPPPITVNSDSGEDL